MSADKSIIETPEAVDNSQRCRADGLVTITDSDSMAVVHVDEVAQSVIIETGDGWIALEPDDLSNVIRSLQMAESYHRSDRE